MRYIQRHPLTLEERIQAGQIAYDKLSLEEMEALELIRAHWCKKIQGVGETGSFELLVALAFYLADSQPGKNNS